jgi:hypothetical protein
MLQNMCPGNGLRMGGLCGKSSKVKNKKSKRDSIFDFLFLTFEFLLLNSLCWGFFFIQPPATELRGQNQTAYH